MENGRESGLKSLKYNDMERMAHPRGFEPLTPAFGAIWADYPNCTLGHAVTRYITETNRQFSFSRRNSYPKLRSDFPPAASVVLPRKQQVHEGGIA